MRGSIVSNVLCTVRITTGRLIETMPATTANGVYISSMPRPVVQRAMVSSMPPCANRIIQPTMRTTLPTNSGSTIASMHSVFQRLVMRASR